MEETEIKEPKAAKKSGGKYVALIGFDTSDGKRFEKDDTVMGLKPTEVSALLEMEAIEEVK
jgi:hypothetical protein